jgi:hypothetical protein
MKAKAHIGLVPIRNPTISLIITEFLGLSRPTYFSQYMEDFSFRTLV